MSLYVTFARFREVLRVINGILKNCVSKDTMVNNIWPKWDSKAIENGFFSRSIAHNETVLQNPFSTILESHQKNLCRSSNKHRGFEDDTEDLVSIATNGYGVKLCAFI